MNSTTKFGKKKYVLRSFGLKNIFVASKNDVVSRLHVRDKIESRIQEFGSKTVEAIMQSPMQEKAAWKFEDWPCGKKYM